MCFFVWIHAPVPLSTDSYTFEKKLALMDLGVIYLEKENCTRQANGKKDKQDDAGLLEADMLDPWWAGALQMNRLRNLFARPTRRDMSSTSASKRWW